MFASRRVVVVLASAVLALASGGCKKAASSGPPPASLPPLVEGEAPHSGAIDRSQVHAPTGAAGMPAGHPPMGGMGELPPGHVPVGEAGGEPRTPGGGELDPKSVVTGELKLDAKLAGKVKEGDVIFLMARSDDGGGPGTLLAVKKLQAGKWPLAFELDSRDAMMTGTKMSGRIVVNARVDKDGDAMSKNPGDVIGKSKPVDLPAQKVVVTLDTVL